METVCACTTASKQSSVSFLPLASVISCSVLSCSVSTCGVSAGRLLRQGRRSGGHASLLGTRKPPGCRGGRCPIRVCCYSLTYTYPKEITHVSKQTGNSSVYHGSNTRSSNYMHWVWCVLDGLVLPILIIPIRVTVVH